jgi:hypothetical protein
VDAAEERAAARDPFRPEAHGFVGAARADVVGKDAESDLPGIRFT